MKRDEGRLLAGQAAHGEPLTVALARGGEAIAGLAVAAEAARRVDALGIALAHGAVLTLVDISKQKRISLEREQNGGGVKVIKPLTDTRFLFSYLDYFC